MNRVLPTVLIVLLSFGTSSAQEQTPEKEKPKTQVETAATPRESGQPLNIKVDLTITEQAGSNPQTVKTVSILAADNNTGRIRSYGGVRFGELNVDVRPRLIQGGRLLVSLTVEYRPVPGGAKEGDPDRPGLSESLTVFLQEGKPLVVSQSADPNSDRKVTLEVRASVLK
jgi:hypothetical protein